MSQLSEKELSVLSEALADEELLVKKFQMLASQTNDTEIKNAKLLSDGITAIKINTPGKFTVYNSLCATACALELGININDISNALTNINGVKGRAEVVPTGKDFTVIIYSTGTVLFQGKKAKEELGKWK